MKKPRRPSAPRLLFFCGAILPHPALPSRLRSATGRKQKKLNTATGLPRLLVPEAAMAQSMNALVPGLEAALSRRRQRAAPARYWGVMLMVISTTPVLAGGKLPVKVQR
jgi:hypothetical protein